MHDHHPKPYVSLTLMAILSFIAMYVLMYAMVDRFSNVYSNINQFYMAGLMTAPMIIIELFVMKTMYDNKQMNTLIIGLSVLLLIIFFTLMRKQSIVSDKQFLRSMIPHHAGAILMCEQAPLEDSEIKELCANIITGQQSEIDWMKAKLESLK